MTVNIHNLPQKIRVETPAYAWEWDQKSDTFSIFDSSQRRICRANHQPAVISTTTPQPGHAKETQIAGDCVSICYVGVNDKASLTVTWQFTENFIRLEPLEYKTPQTENLLRVVYFPGLYSRYAVVPGLCMSTCISPVIDLHAKLDTTVALGSGAMRGPGLTQQWGLPSHYFALFNTSDRWNAINAKEQQSDAACWGLTKLPQGDFRLEIRENTISPVLNIRSDLWKHLPTPATLEIGFSFIITFGNQFHEAIRSYYTTLLNLKLIQPKISQETRRKREVLLAPQYNTWGAESARALAPEQLTGTMLDEIFRQLRRSGMQARTFVIDDKWEGRYGELRHDEARFPGFEQQLETFRSEGFFIGLWAAFLRCQDPTALGLNESHLLQTANREPLWLDHQTARYGIFDVTQPKVQQVLRQRAKEFIRRYRPDLIKFDFGYELPSLDVAAPLDKTWAGEKLLQKGLEIVVGTMKEENPNLVILYYGLSPLLLDYYDLHSPDDLVYCGGDYDLETNRRIFFSSLCGELGMPTYGSSGYDWASALDIWFDSAPAGTLGSLHCFDGDENGDQPTDAILAKYNGLAAILRKNSTFQIQPLDSAWQGGMRAAFAPSWERIEDGKSVLIALRTHKFDGKPTRCAHKSILHSEIMLIVASLNEDDIETAPKIGIVPFNNGKVVLARAKAEGQAMLTEHFFSQRTRQSLSNYHQNRLELNLRPMQENEILEWLEISFSTVNDNIKS